MRDERKGLSTPVTETLNKHVTIRFYDDAPVPDEMVYAILNAARRSPTSSNTQSYSVIMVRDQETKMKLAVLAGNQAHVESCDVFLAYCADISRLHLACQMHDKEMKKSLETTLVAAVDAALVGMSAQTAAESFGLGAVMIGGMRNHPKEVGQLLGLPPGVFVVYGMCLGWPDWELVPPQKPRLPAAAVIHRECYDQAIQPEAIAAYDQELAEHYERLGRNLHQKAWTGPLARSLSETRRPHLKTTLEEMGFSLE